MTVTVVLASPRRATRLRWATLLAAGAPVRLVGEARSGAEALRSAGHRPRVIVLDGALCEREGTALVRAMRRRSPRSRILVVTGAAIAPLDLLSHGARGTLAPRDLPAFLARAVRALDRGEAWVRRRMVASVLDRLVRLSIPAEARPPERAHDSGRSPHRGIRGRVGPPRESMSVSFRSR